MLMFDKIQLCANENLCDPIKKTLLQRFFLFLYQWNPLEKNYWIPSKKVYSVSGKLFAHPETIERIKKTLREEMKEGLKG
jgi:hypothetical protein